MRARIAVVFLFLLMCGTLFAADAKSYQKGKLLEVQAGRASGVMGVVTQSTFLSVQLGDLIYVVETVGRGAPGPVPDELVMGDEADVRVDGKWFYVKKQKKDGEWKFYIFSKKRVQLTEPAPSSKS